MNEYHTFTRKDGLSTHEMDMLNKCETAEDWGNACDFIKGRRGGEYPHDWWDRVKMTGLMDKIMSRWGASSRLTLIDANTGEETSYDD